MSNEVKQELNKWLESMSGTTCYAQNSKIYAPTEYNSLRGTKAVKRLEAAIAAEFRGATIYKNVEGCWVDYEGRLECEPEHVIELGHECTTDKQRRILASAITRYAYEAGQQAVSVKNGQFYIAKSPEMLERHLLESLKEEVPG
jgi:cephalosporin hydroxylase